VHPYGIRLQAATCAAALVVGSGLAVPTAARSLSAGEIPDCTRGSAFSSAQYHLDRFAADWGVAPDNDAPRCSIDNVPSPALDAESLRLGLLGGSSPYASAHFYRHFSPVPAVRQLVLRTSFRYEPASTCDNQGAPSIVQALEFSLNKWQGGRRWEVALQWANVAEGGAQWRYWDPSRPPAQRWMSFSPSIPACLAGNTWHFLEVVGTISGDQVRFERFVIDGNAYNLGLFVPSAAAPGNPDRFAVAFQLDGNSRTDPYNLFVDQVHFLRL
jgi:hypothetical protein